MCFALQGLFSTKIFNKLGMKWYNVLLGDILIIFSPILIYRMYMHTSLAAQWLILLSIYLVLRHDEDYKDTRRVVIYWGIIGFLVAGIHLYFLPMCGMFVVGYAILSIVNEKKIIKSIYPIISFFIGAIFNTWILGGFSTGARSGTYGLTLFSFNLNSFFNPKGYSSFFNDLSSVSDAQGEGFAYIGCGIGFLLVICVIVRIMMICKNKKVNINALKVVFSMIGVVGIILALSPAITFSDKLLVEIPWPAFLKKFGSIFRSTGRFIWLAWYLIAIYIIYSISKINKKNIATMFLTLSVIIQLADLNNIILQKHKYFSKNIAYTINNADFWENLVQYREFEQICICFWSASSNSYYIRPAEIALEYGLNTNGFYFARDIAAVVDQYFELERGESPDAQCIYLFLPEQTDLMKDLENDLRYYYIDDYVVGITWLDNDGKVNDFVY